MKMKPLIVRILAIVLPLVMLFGSASFASVTQSPVTDFVVNADSGGDCIGGSPSMLYDGTNFFSVWVKDSNIYGARVSKNGTVLDPNGIIISYGLNETVNYRQPSVGFDGTNFMVVWAATRSGTNEVYGCRVTKTGQVLDPQGIKLTVGGDVYIKPVGIAFDGVNYLLIWRTNSSIVMGSRLSTVGVPLNNPAGFKIANNGYYPSVAYDEKDKIFMVAWHQGDWGSLIVCGARIDTLGNVLTPNNFIICDDPYDKESARIAFDGTNFMVIWFDWRPKADQFFGSCYGTRITKEAVVLDKPAFKVADRVRGQIFPNIIFDGTNYVAVWSSDSYSENKFRLTDVYATRISTDGKLLDRQPIPVSTAFEHQFGPSIAFGDNKYFVAWNDLRIWRNGGNRALFARIFDKEFDGKQIPFETQTLPPADWTSHTIPGINSVTYGTAFNSDNAYLFSNGLVTKFSNEAWATPESVEFPAVYAGTHLGDDHFWTSGWASCVRNYENKTWNFVSDKGITNSPLISGMCGTDSSNIWASLSYSNKFLNFDGSKWSDFPIPISVDISDIAKISDSDIYAVGEKGTILHFNGAQWALLPNTPTVQTLNSLWIADENDIFAVGDFGTVIHFNGSVWEVQKTCTNSHLKDVWGFKSSDVYAVGFDGTILHYNGVKWSPENCNSNQDLLTVFGGFSTKDNTGTVWAAGYGPVVFQKTKTVLQPGTPTPTSTVTQAPTPTPTLSPTPAPILVTEVKISAISLSIKVNYTAQLTCTVLPSNASDKSVTWISSNSKVCVVLQSGKVTAKATGTSTITVTTADGSKKATCKITVTQPVTSIKLNKASLTILKGKTFKLIPSIYPANASNKKVVWKSSNKALATVSSTGIITAKKKGTATVTVTTFDGKKTAKCKVTVK